ncbi:hypothetical protein P3T76_001731 [Phytophthora citrophthora]|uniref:RxLR effector protein n=1 Tax=Phytophthora citrophthora TaxID=4793 RepID=A0AAD9LQN9_9STRA|nr:hypothetical protein P3T76_001731 [Phytophthora citrophthora]
MRLLLWTLLVALIAILSSCDAASVDENKALQRKLYTKVVPEELAADNGVEHGKRALRAETSKIAPSSVTEERAATVSTGFGSKIKALLRSIKEKYLRWEQKKIVPSFKERAKNGETYSKVRSDQRTRLNWSGLWGTPSGFKRYARLYKTWLENNGYAHLAV